MSVEPYLLCEDWDEGIDGFLVQMSITSKSGNGLASICYDLVILTLGEPVAPISSG